MKTTAIILLIFSFNIFAQSKDSSFNSSQSMNDTAGTFVQTKQMTISKLNAKFDSLESAVNETRNLKSDLILLRAQIDSIKTADKIKQVHRQQYIEQRYQFGKKILNNMIDGTTYLQKLNKLVIIQPQNDTSGNGILEKLHLQNFWDKFNNYSPIIGLVVTGASALFIHNAGTNSIIGLGGVIVPGLLKLAFGHGNISDFESGLQYIGPTKNLYEEFNRQSFLIKELVVQDTTLRDSLLAFKTVYDNCPNVDSLKNKNYLILQDKISEYENIDRQVPLTLNQIREYFDKYKNSPGFSDIYSDFENHSNEFINEYTNKFSGEFSKLKERNREMLFNNSMFY